VHTYTVDKEVTVKKMEDSTSYKYGIESMKVILVINQINAQNLVL